jgi:hypothetical protein
MSDETHKHVWQPNGIAERDRESCSPCSTWDDHLWTDVLSVQVCACGAVKRVVVGFKNRRRRGDDYRRAAGKLPLGTPLQREGSGRVL